MLASPVISDDEVRVRAELLLDLVRAVERKLLQVGPQAEPRHPLVEHAGASPA